MGWCRGKQPANFSELPCTKAGRIVGSLPVSRSPGLSKYPNTASRVQRSAVSSAARMKLLRTVPFLDATAFVRTASGVKCGHPGQRWD